MDILQLLTVNAAITAGMFLVLWRIAVALKDPSFVDSWWALGMVLTAWSSFVLGGAIGPHSLALTGLATVWGLRLGSYLLWRWRKHGPDRRYVTMMSKAKSERGWSFATASLL